MGRPVVLSNGQLFVGIDEDGLVHDFYYPYVGLENLTNARSSQHKIGIWIDGHFSWSNEGDWRTEVSFEEDALIGHIRMSSDSYGISLLLQDFVDNEQNALIRHMTITNQREEARDIRIFMHQVFQISRVGRADTAMYVPDDNFILDYKGRYSLAIGGKFAEGDEQFDQYAVGNYGIEGKAGTFMDAEDGELSGNAVEHGGVDSVIRFKTSLAARSSVVLDYWIIAASSQSDVSVVHNEYLKVNMEDKLRHTRQGWQAWLGGGDIPLPEFHKQTIERSLLVIKAHCDARGSVLASGDSSIFNFGRDYYCYCWPRDAAFALWPLIRLGHFDEAKAFFEFARDTMHKDGYMMHKYQPDRAVGSTWHPLIHGKSRELAIQEDETAGVIFMLGELYEASNDITFIQNIYHSFVMPAANFMCQFVDEQTGLPHASYDLWEEKFLTSTYTVSIVIAALKTAARLSQVIEAPDDSVKWLQVAQTMQQKLDLLYKEDRFVKGFLLQPDGTLAYDMTLDISSLYGPYMFSGIKLDDLRLTSTAKQVETILLNASPSGGVVRYEHDNYFLAKQQFLGNPWIVSTLWLSQYYETTGNHTAANQLLEWAIDRQLPSGVLSEQFDPETGSPLGVTPLVWSHAEMVNTLLDVSQSTIEPQREKE